MLVSVILNNYNYDAYLSQAIDSALGQTYDNIEVIVVDDGSTDSSKDIILGYGDKINAIFKENGGQVSAVNMGWEASKGEVIIFLDSDDVLFPETVEECVKSFNSGDYSGVYYLLEDVDANLKPIGKPLTSYEYKEKTPLDDIKLWGYYVCSPTSGQAFRREFLERVMPTPKSIIEYGYELAPDGYLSMLCGITENIFFINKALGYYRVHGNNKSNAGNYFSKYKIRRLFMREYIREEYGRAHAKKNNIEIKKDLSVYHPAALKLRLIAFRLYPDGHPIEGDTRLNLLTRGLKGVFIFPYVPSLKKRIIIFFGIITIALAPKFLIRPFVDVISSQNKKENLKNMLRLNKKKNISCDS